MNIYDSFLSKKAAYKAVKQIRKLKTERGTSLRAYVYMNQDTANKHDPFPFKLIPPIVHVSREGDGEPKLEKKLAKIIEAAGGEYCGT